MCVCVKICSVHRCLYVRLCVCELFQQFFRGGGGGGTWLFVGELLHWRKAWHTRVSFRKYHKGGAKRNIEKV